MRVASAALGLTLTISGAIPPQRSPDQGSARRGRPNILLVSIDTLRPDHLSTYGYTQRTDPSIHALAREAIVFEDVMAPVPLTLPSHVSLFTGLHPMSHGVRDNDQPWSGGQQSLPEILKGLGYETRAWVSSYVLSARFGLSKGFDSYDDHFLSSLRRARTQSLERAAGETVFRVEEWLRGRDTSVPFLAFVHLYDPHTPYRAPSPFAGRFSHPYDDEIAHADASLGRLFDLLRKKGLWERTIILITSDHGEGLGDHSEATHGYFVYQSTMKIPLVVKPAAPNPVARRITAPVHLMDLAPTLVRIAGGSPPAAFQGQVIRGLFEESPAARARGPDRPLYGESYYFRFHFNWSQLRVFREGSYKLIASPRPELFDLSSDPGERKNIFAQKRAVGLAMLSNLDRFIRRFGKSPVPASGARVDAATLERLKSLGYSSVTLAASPVDDAHLPDPKSRTRLFARVQIAESLVEEKKIAEAIPALRAVLQEDPGIVRAGELLALSLEDAGRWDEAAAEYERLEKSIPFSPQLSSRLGLVYARLGRIEKGIGLLQKAIALASGDFLLHYNLGYLQQAAGRSRDAIASYQRSVELEPRFAESRFNLGKLLLELKEPASASSHFAVAVEIEPEWKEAHNSLGICLAVLQRTEEAIVAWRKALSIDPGYIDARSNLAQALQDLGRTDEAAHERALMRGKP